VPPKADNEREWEYEVQFEDVSYWVVISDSLSVQSVARIVQIEGTDRRAGSVIWHKGHNRMTREASRAIQAARIHRTANIHGGSESANSGEARGLRFSFGGRAFTNPGRENRIVGPITKVT
jgi:hypothetical protein